MAFQSFVVLAQMRTGSNFLEANLNALDGVTCHGEAFNSAFIGYPNRDSLLDMTQAERDENPQALLTKIKVQVGMHGFRYFYDHDPRVLDTVLNDASCAKIILTRNPIDSYISLKIANATGQWKLTNAKMARSQQIPFDRSEFEQHLSESQAFQVQILNALQRSGQTGFYIGYDDLRDVDVLNGLAEWLGVNDRLDAIDSTLKPQNPKPAVDKVANADAMADALARLDEFNLSATPNFEPRRGPVAPSYIAAGQAPLLYQGIRGGPEAAMRAWLTKIDGELIDGFTQSTLRKWQRTHKTQRSFTVLRHPLARIHATFCEKILPTDGDAYVEIREQLRRHHKVPLKARADAPGYDHRAAFEAFLDFVQQNLNGQTSIRVDPWWTTQTAVIQGFAELRTPDILIREDELSSMLPLICAQIGIDMPALPAYTDPHLDRLMSIYDGTLEQRARKIYQRDFLNFGFSRLN